MGGRGFGSSVGKSPYVFSIEPEPDLNDSWEEIVKGPSDRSATEYRRKKEIREKLRRKIRDDVE
jgi:hypothetical protein